MASTLKRQTIVIFTDKFPYSGESERTFMLPELEAASAKFERVILVPTALDHECGQLPALPSNVTVETGWAPRIGGVSRWMRTFRLLNPSTWKYACGDVSRSGLTFVAVAQSMADWIHSWINRTGVDLDATLFYSFWFDIAAAALAIERRRNPSLRFCASAHGFDIFTHRGGAMRSMMLRQTDHLYVASRSGYNYIAGGYPESKEKLSIRTLGCVKLFPDALSEHNSLSSRKITVLSVANVVPGKRVLLNAQLMRGLAIARDDTRVHWIHVGDGPEMPALRRWLESTSQPANFSWTLRGALSNREVQRIYTSEPIDWFMLMSLQEGGNPVSACEAMAYGVPLILSDTTGLSEMAYDDMSVLMPMDVAREEFVRGMAPYLDSDVRHRAMSDAAYERWRREYDASRLRGEFFEKLSNGTL